MILLETWYATLSAGGHQGLVISEKTGKTVAVVYDATNDDARLIAAAPELLEALKELMPLAERDIEEYEADFLRAERAIAQAEGRE